MSTEPSAKSSSKSGVLAWIFGVIAVLAIAAAAFLWSRQATAGTDPDAAADATPRAEALYYPLAPVFVVNLADEDQLHYLQAEVELLTHDEPTRAALEKHAPALRNRLLLLFGEQHAADLRKRAAKEELQAKALAEVVAVLEAEGAPAGVDQVIFTSLVTQ